MKLPIITTTLAILLLGMQPAVSQEEENPGAWPDLEKQASVAACRQNVLSSAWRSQLSKQGLSAEQMAQRPFESAPEDVQREFIKRLDPLFQTCDCFVDIMSTEVPWDEYQKSIHGDNRLIATKQREIMASGRCAPARKPPPDLQKAADDGDANAQFQLGIMYAEGRGVNEDERLARRWLMKAAQQGHAGARSYLDEMQE